MRFNNNTMTIRHKYSIVLLFLGAILAILSLSGTRSFTVKPEILLPEILDQQTIFTVDQVAKFIISEEKQVQIIDLRSPEEFMLMNIPGSVNVPYDMLIDDDPDKYIIRGSRNIIYSNGDLNANYAMVILKGLNYNDVYVMKGGMNEWFKTIMNSSFSGERISARENSLFEGRMKARKLFVEINSLPDSLKLSYMENRRAMAKKLDGGCE